MTQKVDGRGQRSSRVSQILHPLLVIFDILSDSDWKTSHEADSCGSCFSKMDHRQAKLVAEPTWSAHADWPNVSGDESSTTPIPPWRNQSIWRITTTKTVEGQDAESSSSTKLF